MYLQVRINNQLLDLYENTKARFKYYNPAFRQSGGKSLPFTVPKTPKNLQLTGYVDRLDITAPQKVENASIWLDGIPWDYGVLKIRAASDRSIEVYFEQTYTDLLKELEAVLIKTLAGALNVGTPQWHVTFQISNLSTVEMQQYGVTIDGVQYTYQQQQSDTIDNIFNALVILINADHPNMAVKTAGQLTLSGNTPKVIQLIQAPGISIVSSTTYEAAAKALWTTYINNPNADGVVFPLVINWKLYADNTIFEGRINPFLNGAYILDNIGQNRPNDFRYTIAPFVLLSSIFEAMQNNHNFNIDGAFINDTDIQNLFFVHNQTIDNSLKDMLTGHTYINSFKTAADLNQFVPDMNAAELLNGFKQFFCLAFFWSEENRTLTPILRSDLLETSVEDWTNKAAIAYKSTLPKLQGYRLEYQNDKADTTSNVENQPIGDGETVYTLPIASPVQRNILTDEGMRSTILLEQIQTGDFSARLAIYKGLQPSNTNIDYPQAKGISLSTILNDYWQSWANFLNTAKALNKNFDLSINDLLKLKTFENPMKSIQSEVGSGVGMVSEFSFEAGTKSISTVDVQLFIKSV